MNDFFFFTMCTYINHEVGGGGVLTTIIPNICTTIREHYHFYQYEDFTLFDDRKEFEIGIVSKIRDQYLHMQLNLHPAIIKPWYIHSTYKFPFYY